MQLGHESRFQFQLYPSDINTDIRDSEYPRFVDMLRRGAIRCFMQPIYDLYTGRIFGYELLARGIEPFLSPLLMFQKAEEWNLTWELEYACRIAALNRVAELSSEMPMVNFFINISPDTFSKPEFQSSFTMERLKQFGISAEKLVLEITETASVKDYDHFEKTIGMYVEQGFRIALDDFGSGHSGLITLAATTPHFMKIDKQLVQGIHRNSYKQNLVKAIADFAENVGSYILLEGIETADELRTAYRLGARYGQGFYLGKPSPEPRSISKQTRTELDSLMNEYVRKSFSVDISIYKMITRPATFFQNSLTVSQLDDYFRTQNGVNHIIITDKQDHPFGLITKQGFYSHLSGRYGYAIFERKYIDTISNQNMLIVRENIDLRMLGKLAMSRTENGLYDPVVIVDKNNRLVGTITMKNVIARAFDTEIKFATSANPLTSLPGNVIINVWLEDVLHKPEYSIAYIDLDRFKEYNDHYGFSAGDEMIKLQAEVLAEKIQTVESDCRLGHIGGDDFVLICEEYLGKDFFNEICAEFDFRKKRLFSEEDIKRGSYLSSNRKGEIEEVPLVTLSIGVVTNKNFARPPHPGKLGQSVAHLKSKIKEINYKNRTSGYLFERRVYSEETIRSGRFS